MEKRETKTFTEDEIYNMVQEASLDFLYRTRCFISNTILYYSWLDMMERFVEENMNVVVVGFIENGNIKENFRYQHSYWTEYNDVLLEFDGARRVTLSDWDREHIGVNVKKISWDVDKFQSHGLMLKIYIVFEID